MHFQFATPVAVRVHRDTCMLYRGGGESAVSAACFVIGPILDAASRAIRGRRTSRSENVVVDDGRASWGVAVAVFAESPTDRFPVINPEPGAAVAAASVPALELTV